MYIFNNIKEKEILDLYNKALNEAYYVDAFIGKLVDFATKNHISGNIWKKYILYTLIYNENSYTLSIEKNRTTTGINKFARLDLEYFYNLYNSNASFLKDIEGYDFLNDSDNLLLSNSIEELYNNVDNKDLNTFITSVEKSYKKYGVGYMALYKAFRVEDAKLYPIYNMLNVTFDDIIGYESQKALLIENTINFLEGRKYNNILLYGESGTGKSTSIKALLNTYFDKGLRIIEVYKHQMSEIAKIINTLKSRPYHYVIYMDDLSFEEDEIEYKYLKSIIEGGIEPKPDNVAIYATSNRRHLIKEVISDNGTVDDDLHRNETQAEKLSLVYRFGLQIYYSSLTPAEFRNMVIELAKKNNIVYPEKELLIEANKFEMRYGSLSGRCAEQFINYLSNKIVK